MISQLDF